MSFSLSGRLEFFGSWFQFVEMKKSEERPFIGSVSANDAYWSQVYDFLRTLVAHSIHTSIPGMLAFTPKPLIRACTRRGSSTKYSRGTDWQAGQVGSSARS
jgi:hypothetical protein